jgi:hypothetical protein
MHTSSSGEKAAQVRSADCKGARLTTDISVEIRATRSSSSSLGTPVQPGVVAGRLDPTRLDRCNGHGALGEATGGKGRVKPNQSRLRGPITSAQITLGSEDVLAGLTEAHLRGELENLRSDFERLRADLLL